MKFSKDKSEIILFSTKNAIKDQMTLKLGNNGLKEKICKNSGNDKNFNRKLTWLTINISKLTVLNYVS